MSTIRRFNKSSGSHLRRSPESICKVTPINKKLLQVSLLKSCRASRPHKLHPSKSDTLFHPASIMQQSDTAWVAYDVTPYVLTLCEMLFMLFMPSHNMLSANISINMHSCTENFSFMILVFIHEVL